MLNGKYKIKTWEAMEEEFGLDSIGDIACDKSFVIDMEKAMPEDRIILVEGSHWSDEYWEISKDMIECKVEE